MAAESPSDLEAPLLNSKSRRIPHERGISARLQRAETEPPSSSDLEPRRKWKQRALLGTHMHSGRWQFQYHKYLERNDFAETEGLSEGKREYNRKQREVLAAFAEVDSITTQVEGDADPSSGKEKEEQEKEDKNAARAINLSNFMNVFLLVVKIYASVKSGSLSIVASALDSLLDLVSGFVLWFSHYYMQREERYKYPIGKLRIQPVGIVIFTAVMATLGLQVFLTGIQELISGDKERMDPGQEFWLIVIMGLVIVIKLSLYLYCSSFDNEIVNVYAMDHFFDTITNLVGLAAALLANSFYWWIDPVGAIMLAVYTMFNWGKTLLENASSLVGKAAPPETIQKLTYMALNHHSQIQRIDTVRAYTFGNFYFVEVDIELPEEMILRTAHEIGESLQNKLERLPEVERAFVHLDYESLHRPEHSAAEAKQ